jgi:uncharacterized membrane protein HdeD (DUF308 family)
MNLSALLLIRGVVGVAIGMLAFAWPGITIAVLVAIFGVYAIVDGITNLMLGLRRDPVRGRSWAHSLQGVVGIVAGVLAFLWPGITALALVTFIGAWALITGAFEIIAAVRLRKVITGEWMLALSGIMSIVFGIFVFLFPGAGAVGIAWILGAYSAGAGIVLIALAVTLRTRLLATA